MILPDKDGSRQWLVGLEIRRGPKDPRKFNESFEDFIKRINEHEHFRNLFRMMNSCKVTSIAIKEEIKPETLHEILENRSFDDIIEITSAVELALTYPKKYRERYLYLKDVFNRIGDKEIVLLSTRGNQKSVHPVTYYKKIVAEGELLVDTNVKAIPDTEEEK